MVTRVSTSGSYSAVLANLLAAQQRQTDAGSKVATQKNGSNLKDYARDADMLTAMRTLKSRMDVYVDQNSFIAEKLANQDTALNRVADAARDTKQIIAEALASGQADTLIEDLEAQLRNAIEGMNARYGGKYLFAGGQVDTKPVTATDMASLAPPAVIANLFLNDDYKATAQVDEATTVTTGILAEDIGTDLLNAYRALQVFHTGGSGPFTGQLTAAQKTFLEGQLTVWEGVRSDAVSLTARNGLTQQRVESVKEALISRQNALAGMMGDITDADMAEAASNLQQAQLSVQAAAHVFASLAETSLLNILK